MADTSWVSFFMPQNKQSEVVVLPRARSPNRDKAFEIWIQSGQSIMLKDIAAELGVSESQIRKWKNQDKWDQSPKVTLPKGNSNVTKKQGAPKGNKNAAGHGAPKHNQNNRKHGAYEQIFWDSLDEDELALIEAMNLDAEEHLLEQEIQLLTVKEHRMLKDIADYKSRKGGLALDSVVKRNLEIEGNLVKDNRQSQNETTTKTIATFEVIAKLEDGLLKTQRAKIKAIGDLAKLRIAKKDSEDPENLEDDGFIEAMLANIDDIWQDGGDFPDG